MSFDVKRGEVFGLLGPNGSGKTTTMKTMLGLLAPTSGEVSLLGGSPSDPAVRRRTGYLPEENILFRHQRSEEELKNFPVLINRTNTSLISKCDKGNSIRFSSLDNSTEFFYEIEEWTENGFSIWVNISEMIQPDSDYKFLMYYNNSFR